MGKELSTDDVIIGQVVDDEQNLVDLMRLGDELGEAERRYTLIARYLDPTSTGEGTRALTGTEIKALSIEADRLMVKIKLLRDAKKSDEALVEAQSNVVPMKFDVDRFSKSG